jgi:hypothetical protein
MAAAEEDQSIAHVEEFNRTLKRLTTTLASRYPTDAVISRMKKRLILSTSVTPLFLIDTVGPYLYKYRTQIYSEDEGFFIENEYGAELQRCSSAEEASVSLYVIRKAKEAWLAAKAADRGFYIEIVKTLLDVYLEYLAAKH